MVKKKTKRLPSRNGVQTNSPLQESIKKYCTKRKINKNKQLCDKISKNRHLRNKKTKKLPNTPENDSNNKNNRKKPLLNVQNDITLYETKPLSPTKLSISVKKFYNVSNIKHYEENLCLYEKNKIHLERMTDNNKNKDIHNWSKDEKPYSPTKIKNRNIKNCRKPYDLIPKLNKEKYKQNKKYDNKTKPMEVYNRKNNFREDEIHVNTQITNETHTNENETRSNEILIEEYRVTPSPINALSISVKRFYRSVPSKSIENEKVNKDMPLVSDTTFNSKADFIQSPSSKLNISHKISLHVKHINDTTNDKQQKVTAFFPIRRSARKTKNTVNEEKQKALEKAIVSQNEDGLKIAVFPNKGRGIIAAQDFSRGEYVVEYAGELVSLSEARKREIVYSQDTTTGCYMYYFKYGTIHYCIDATAESSRLGRLVNHSRFGNLGPKVVELSGLPRIVLIAKTDIKAGEELTYDYGDRSKKSLINHPWLAY